MYIVNTCTVTNMSDRKSRQILRKAKSNNKDAILVATGCYAQVSKKQLEEIEEIDIIAGNNEKKDIVRYVEEFEVKREEVSDISKKQEYIEFGMTAYTEKTRAVIKVQDGCDNFCSYCIIPYARGRIRSRKLENVISEIKEIVSMGIKEVVLTGIQIAHYGRDLEGDIRLIDLLEEINKIEGLERIRIGSLEPRLLTEEFIDRLKQLEKICHHFHLSLQSGCTDTLKRMNRKYTKEDIINLAKMLRENFEDAILTADVIVGFPGETEEEFSITYETLKEMELYKIHVFQYSIREGTRAETFENQVEPEIKEKRSKILLELSDKVHDEINESYVSKKVKVLIEEKQGDYYKGHTANYMEVLVPEQGKDIRNEIVEVKIKSVKKSCPHLLGNIKHQG